LDQERLERFTMSCHPVSRPLPSFIVDGAHRSTEAPRHMIELGPPDTGVDQKHCSYQAFFPLLNSFVLLIRTTPSAPAVYLGLRVRVRNPQCYLNTICSRIILGPPLTARKHSRTLPFCPGQPGPPHMLYFAEYAQPTSRKQEDLYRKFRQQWNSALRTDFSCNRCVSDSREQKVEKKKRKEIFLFFYF
jgi:hypothetical protein